MGLAQPLGFALGLVLGGVMLCLVVGIWTIPADSTTQSPSLERLKKDIDWTGAVIATACLALFSYVLV